VVWCGDATSKRPPVPVDRPDEVDVTQDPALLGEAVYECGCGAERIGGSGQGLQACRALEQMPCRGFGVVVKEAGIGVDPVVQPRPPAASEHGRHNTVGDAPPIEVAATEGAAMFAGSQANQLTNLRKVGCGSLA